MFLKSHILIEILIRVLPKHTQINMTMYNWPMMFSGHGKAKKGLC